MTRAHPRSYSVVTTLLCCVCLLAAVSATNCYTHFLELDGTTVALRDGDGALACASVWHTNQRTVHAAALTTHGADVALLCHYADAPTTVRLERYALATGAYLDGVEVERDAAAAPPQRFCLTNYAAFALELDGTLTRYDRLSGAITPLAPSAAATTLYDLVCTDSRLFAVTATQLVVELDTADALLKHVLLRMPDPRHLELVSDGAGVQLRIELGRPAMFSALLDVDSRSLLAFVSAQQLVLSEAALAAQCLVAHMDPYTGVPDVLVTDVRTSCTQIADARIMSVRAPLVVADGLVWTVDSAACTVCAAAPPAGALYNDGNLGALVAVAPRGDGNGSVWVLDSGGRGALLTIDAATCSASVAASRPPSLSYVGDTVARVLSLSDDGVLWMADTGVVMARRTVMSPTDVELPQLGGAVFDGAIEPELAATLLLATKLRFLDADQPSISSDVPLPDVLIGDGAIQRLTLLDRATLARITGSAIELWRTDLTYSELELVCTWRASGLPQSGRLRLLGLTNTAGGSAVVAVPGTGSAIELPLHNCSRRLAWPPFAVDSTAVAALFSAGGAHQCLFGVWRPSRRGMDTARLAELVSGLCIIVAALCCWALVIFVGVRHRKNIRRLERQAAGEWRKTGQPVLSPSLTRLCVGPQAQCVCHYALCCVPPLRSWLIGVQQRNDVVPLHDYGDSVYTGPDDTISGGIVPHVTVTSSSGSSVMQPVSLHGD